MNKLMLALIRHGKTEANEKHLYCGKSNISLSEKGIKELNDIKNLIKYPEYNKFFSSGAKRANETLEILYPKKVYYEINEFWEYDFGDFEMKSYDMLKENKEYINWITDKDGQVSCPNGESKIQYRERIKEAFNKFIEKCYKEGIGTAVLVCHGGTIGTILEIFYDCSKSFYEHQPACGRGYTLTLEKKHKGFEIVNIDNI
ncbi:MAG: histidine phosphatase family protein [Clostridium sp.]|uniref:histidine phosphatase family protein n=1 Tax=Clostridium sp. TaxID=1506 RepID=UPI0025BB36B4|nr:histidine phosphatase family protein [Clostridium sp.]MBS4958009.1 histidine phosphatase family protein [Clostridium sp.]